MPADYKCYRCSEERIQTYQEARNLSNRIVRRQKRLAEKKAIENIENYKANYRMFYINVNRSRKDTKHETALCLMRMRT